MFLVFKAKKGPTRWVSKHVLVFNNFNTLTGGKKPLSVAQPFAGWFPTTVRLRCLHYPFLNLFSEPD